MEELETLYSQTFDLSTEGYKVIDRNFNIVACNNKYVELNNLTSKQDVLGKKCNEYLCSSNCGTERCSLLKVLGGEKSIETTIERRIGNNERKYYLLNIKPYINKNQDIAGIIECFIDVTSIKTAELALRERESQLKKVNATKDKLFSIVAHDLRSPFTSILGFSEILIENLKDLEIAETEAFVRNINSSAQNTLYLLENLLNWAKTQTESISVHPQSINLSLIIGETIKISRVASGQKNIALNYKQESEIVLYSDANMLKTVLRNLLSNAIKFTNEGGNIDIVAVSESGNAEITVSDNGIGMNENLLKNLFEISVNRSSAGTANEKGSGLGLVLCKEFVEKLGGSIRVESKPGQGSKFIFEVPLHTSFAN